MWGGGGKGGKAGKGKKDGKAGKAQKDIVKNTIKKGKGTATGQWDKQLGAASSWSSHGSGWRCGSGGGGGGSWGGSWRYIKNTSKAIVCFISFENVWMPHNGLGRVLGSWG